MRALRLVFLGAALLFAPLAGGCYQDMLRATPFASDLDVGGPGLDAGRVSLWPLFYHRRSVTSILWPIGEVTDRSWAVRPLVAWYLGKIDVLWPFFHADTVEKDGYLLPLLWYDWNDYFLTPLIGMSLGDDGNRWFYTPLFFTSSEAKGEVRFSVIPPLLAWWGHAGDRQSYRVIAPLLTWWGHNRVGQNAWFFCPFYGRWRAGDATTQALPPLLLVWRESKELGTSLYSPLLCLHRAPTWTLTVVPPLLSWWRTFAEEGWSVDVLLSAFGMTRTPTRSSEHLFPLYWRGRDTNGSIASYFALVPFYAAVDAKRGATFRAIPALLSARTTTSHGGVGWHLLLSAIAWGAREGGPGSPDATFSRILPFYNYHHLRGSTHLILPPLLGDASWRRDEDGVRVWDVDFLLYLFGASADAHSDACRFFPLFWYTHRSSSDEEDEIVSPARKTAPARGEETSFHFLVILYDYLHRELDDGRRHTRHRILWRLFHDEWIDDKHSVDIFPFITYDTEGEDSLTWSWLYTFIRYERRGARRSLNLFFLPAITWGEE